MEIQELREYVAAGVGGLVKNESVFYRCGEELLEAKVFVSCKMAGLKMPSYKGYFPNFNGIDYIGPWLPHMRGMDFPSESLGQQMVANLLALNEMFLEYEEVLQERYGQVL